MFINFKNNIVIILLLVIVILSCLYFISYVKYNRNIELFTNSVDSYIGYSTKYDTSYNYKILNTSSILEDRTSLKFTVRPSNKITSDICNTLTTSIPNNATALQAVYDNSYDGYYINTDNSFVFFTLKDKVEIHINNSSSNNKLTGDISNNDVSSNNINMLLRYGLGNDISNNVFIDISNSSVSKIKSFYINDKIYIKNSIIYKNPPSTSSTPITSATGGNVGNITVNQTRDASLFNYLLAKSNPNLTTTQFNPYTDVAFEHAMNSNLNPLVNYPSSVNPLQYSNRYFNPNASDSIMKNASLNNNITQVGDTTTPIEPKKANSIIESSNNQLLTLPKSNQEIRDTVSKINLDNREKSLLDKKLGDNVECTCPDKKNYLDESQCPPCPACDRCPESDFDCIKVNRKTNLVSEDVNNIGNSLNSNTSLNTSNNSIPRPVLADFSTFGM